MDPHEIPEPSADPAVNLRRLRWGLAGFLVVALYFLALEHRAHLLGAMPAVLGVLPWLLVLACPLMHLFMHRRHGSRQGHAPGPNQNHGEAHKEHGHGGQGCC